MRTVDIYEEGRLGRRKGWLVELALLLLLLFCLFELTSIAKTLVQIRDELRQANTKAPGKGPDIWRQ